MTATLIDSPSETAETRFVEADGIRFAYRRLGRRDGVPLVLLQHFTGTMDTWDPDVVDGLAAARPVILFDNTGVSRSSGTTPDNARDMARHALAFIRALGLEQVDLLGFSLGGFVAQILAAEHPDLVRRVILAGTGPEGGEGIANLPQVLEQAQQHSPERAPPVPVLLPERLRARPQDAPSSSGRRGARWTAIPRAASRPSGPSSRPSWLGGMARAPMGQPDSRGSPSPCWW